MRKALVTLFALPLVAMMAGSCGKSSNNNQMEINNALSAEEKKAGILTPEVMWKMSRMGGSTLSPDGTKVVYTLTRYNMGENKGLTSMFLLNLEDNSTTQLSDNGGSDNSPVWSSDGQSIYYLSSRSGSGQVWRLDLKKNKSAQVTDIEGGIESFLLSPKGDKIAYTKGVQVAARRSSDIYTDLDKSKSLIYDDLMARHWDYWDEGMYSHIFVADYDGKSVTNGVDIMQGEAWDAPMAPYFDASEIAWNNAGTQIAYTCKKLTGAEYAVSTNSDIYVYDLNSKTTRNMTEGMPGYDRYPRFSPDDSMIAFQSMERAGNESDKERLFVVNVASGMKQDLTSEFDYNATNLTWDGFNTLYFLSPINATHQICRVEIGGPVRTLTSGDHDITGFSMVGQKIVAELMTISSATEMYAVNKENGALSKLTDVNKEIYENIKMGEVQKRWVTTTDGKQMLTWVILPPNFDPYKKYPTLLYCQGGPQSVVSQFWSYRWNFQLMAAQGYIVVAPNRRGLPSFGQEWLDQISGDYSGQNIRDYLSAIDDVAKEPWADETRMGCVGASYGGYSAFYLAGNHEKRFKAFIAHCGIFNFESMYGETEELWFVNNDYGGAYWSKDPVAMRSYANSPHKFVDKWDAPILIVTGLKDFRLPYTQSLEAFTAARMHNIPSRLVAFENEAHQVFKPQNSLAWNREFFGWLDKYLKN